MLKSFKRNFFSLLDFVSRLLSDKTGLLGVLLIKESISIFLSDLTPIILLSERSLSLKLFSGEPKDLLQKDLSLGVLL